MNNKLVLAFSGGLDTSFCAIYLKQQGWDVHSALVNTGGFSSDELMNIQEKAQSLGVSSHCTLEKTSAYYQQIIRYLIYGNVLKNNSYPLSVSAERIFQAIALVEYAKTLGAKAIAHGSTGAGNDQVRFDLLIQILAPELEIVTPIRDLQLSRQEEIAFLEKNGISISWEKAQYSINKGLWGTSIGGAETLTSHKGLPEEAFPSQLIEETPSTLQLSFEKGELVGVNDQMMDSVSAIQLVESIASKYAIGRDIHVGDTIIGIKGRVGFEAAAATIIIKAHHSLEKHTLSKWQLHWKEQMGSWYGMFIHEAQYLDPVMRNIEQFLESTQVYVNGKVSIELAPYRFQITGVTSPNDLMNAAFGTYGEMNNHWTGDDVKGFTKIMANAHQVFHHINKAI